MPKQYLNQSTYRAGILQSKAYRVLTAFMTRYLEPYDISVPEWALLGSLSEHGKQRPSTLSTELGVKSPVVTRLLRRLEAKQLITTKADKSDGRGVYVALTTTGEKRAKELEVQLRAEMRQWLGDIDTTELATYLHVMEQIAALK